ncbi:hypothetical protein FRAAL3107 [Frankia alni ACN14a]|uniref:Uncharacterized protein n=1 Tax=Frankia alni (strain DSM 45986 / CECT 9034 / ACN14a) TaxID=326424 RepID=Q0RL54_FRAAA|nr:hypothetical protein FRAAL3107 [Frankia alni ACN14a]
MHALLAREREGALSPAIERALETAQMYLFLALGYVGHTDELFPDELHDPSQLHDPDELDEPDGIRAAQAASPSTDPTEAEGIEP